MNFFYQITIYPLELAYRFLYELATMLSGNYGLALFVLSVLTALVFIPLKKFASRLHRREMEVQRILAPQLAGIKKESRGEERQVRINALYRRYGYHPLLSLRASVGVLLQVPFLCAAFFMLSGFAPIQGQGFLMIADLGQPDGLFFGLNVLPFVMTLVNIAAVCTAPDFGRKDRIQALFVAGLFLVLLYAAPSALLIYWTGNNLLSLLANLWGRIRTKGESGAAGPTSAVKLPFLRDPALSISLGLLLPYVLFWSNNAHFFEQDQLLFSGLALLALAALMFFCARLFRSFALRAAGPQREKRVDAILCPLYTALGFAFLAYLLRMYYPMDISPHLIFALVVIIGTGVVFFLRLNKALNFFLLAMLCISLVSLVMATTAAPPQDPVAEQGAVLPDDLRLKRKPNVYLFILESMQDFPILERKWGMDDTESFKFFLEDNDFFLYPDTYSNSDYTLMSVCDLFTLRDYSFLGQGNFDIFLEGRLIIGGNDKNTVLKTFKDKGYYTEILWLKEQGYFIREKGKNLDKCDLPPSFALLRLVQPVLAINRLFGEVVFPEPEPLPLEEAISQSLAARPADQPCFLTIKAGATHPLLQQYTWRPDNDWKDSGVYQEAVRASFAELQPILAGIIARDPGALIILIGDHGPHRFNNFIPLPYPGDKVFDQLCKTSGLSRQEVARDLFGVMLAVRMPDGRQDISRGLALSQRNLFLHIFSQLAEDPALLRFRNPSVSKIIGGLVLVREGRVLDHWQKQGENKTQQPAVRQPVRGSP